MKSLSPLVILMIFVTAARADLPDGVCGLPADRLHNTDWFSHAGWGIFVHYLNGLQNDSARPNSMGKKTSWNDAVKDFDTEKFAGQIKETGASYVIFTMMQRGKYLNSPNPTYDKLTGYKPGEACVTRDLVEDLYQSLHKRGIKLMLYWTGDGPQDDPQAAKALAAGGSQAVYIQNWADVAACYGEHYKDKIAGFWVDGCYASIGYNQEKWGILARGLRAGSPTRIIGLNNPYLSRANSSTPNDDYTTGEMNSCGDLPKKRWRDGVQWHVLSFLGNTWADPGLRYSPQWMADYVSRANAVGGVVSIDVALFRDGSIAPAQLKCLKLMQEKLGTPHAPAAGSIPGGCSLANKPSSML